MTEEKIIEINKIIDFTISAKKELEKKYWDEFTKLTRNMTWELQLANYRIAKNFWVKVEDEFYKLPSSGFKSIEYLEGILIYQ